MKDYKSLHQKRLAIAIISMLVLGSGTAWADTPMSDEVVILPNEGDKYAVAGEKDKYEINQDFDIKGRENDDRIIFLNPEYPLSEDGHNYDYTKSVPYDVTINSGKIHAEFTPKNSANLNALGIYLNGMYKGTVQLTQDGADIAVVGHGSNQNVQSYGIGIDSWTAENPKEATLEMGNNSKVSVQLDGDHQLEANAIYNYKGTFIAGDGLQVTASTQRTGSNANATAKGIYNASGADTQIGDNLTIETKSSRNAFGIWNVSSKVKTGKEANISATGQNQAIGVYALGKRSTATTLGDGATITANGQAMGIGVYATGKTSTTLGDKATVTAEGNQAYGIYAGGTASSTTLGDGATVKADGKTQALGVYNFAGAHTTFAGAADITAKAEKGTAYAIVSKGQVAKNKTGTDIVSVVDLSNPGSKNIEGDLLANQKGKILLNMDADSQLKGNVTANNAGQIDLTLMGTDGDKNIQGKLKATNQGILNIKMDQAAKLTGTPQVENNGVVNFDLANNSQWNVTQNSEINSLKLNSGAIVNLAANLAAYHNLKVQDFSGQDGTFLMKFDSATENDSDKVHIKNAAAGSSAQLMLYDKSFATSQEGTSAHHLLLVTDDSKNAKFTAKSYQTGGLYEVTPTLSDEQHSEADKWYLVKLTKKANADTKPILRGIDGTYSLYRASMDTLRQRLGDIRYHQNREDKLDTWFRSRNGHYAGSGYDSSYHYFQVGIDTMPNDTSAYGFLVERGIASPDYTTGNGKNHTLAGAIYGTWLGHDGSYTDVVAKVGRNDTTIHTYGAYPDAADYRAHEKSLSLEYGRTLDLGGNGYYIEPQVQFTLGHLSSNSYTTRRGTHVHEDGFHSAIGRLGFVLGKRHKEGNTPYDFYVKASLLHEFGDDRTYSLRRVNAFGDEESFDSQYSYGDTWYELGLGGSMRLNKSTYFYADVERSFANDFNKKWQFNVGLSWAW